MRRGCDMFRSRRLAIAVKRYFDCLVHRCVALVNNRMLVIVSAAACWHLERIGASETDMSFESPMRVGNYGLSDHHETKLGH